MAWDVAEAESAEIAADLVQRACLMDRYRWLRSFGSHQCNQLILHAVNGNATRGATMEWRLEVTRVLISFSRPRVSNDSPYSESLFRTVNYRPGYPSSPFASKKKPANGWPLVRTGAISIPPSNSSRLTSVTAVPPRPFVSCEPMSSNSHARAIQDAVADPLSVDNNLKKFGSTSQQRNTIRAMS